MGDQEEYERGVNDGQKAGALDQISNSFSRVFGNPAYDKGFDYGVDHKPSNSGTNSEPSGSSSWWESSSKSGNESSAPDVNTSSGGGYSGGGGGGSSTSTGIGGLLGLLGAVVIGGAVCFNILGSNKSDMKRDDSMITIEDYRRMSEEEKTERILKYSQELKQGLEDHVKVLAQYLQQSGKIKGDLKNYQFITASRMIMMSPSDYKVAVISNNFFQIFQSSDMGRTWNVIDGIDSNPFLFKLEGEYMQYIRNNEKAGKSRRGRIEDWLKTLKSRSESCDYSPFDY